MKKRVTKFFAILMVAAMTASVSVASFAAYTDADVRGFSGGGGEGGMSGANGSDMPDEDSVNDYYADEEDTITLSGYAFYSENFAQSAIAASGCTALIFGGSEDVYSVSEIAALSEATAEYLQKYASDEEGFNSYIVLGASESSDGYATAGNGITADSGTLNITNAYIQTSGATGSSLSGRYGVATLSKATTIINDSYVIHTGATEETSDILAPSSNEALLISGHGRANFSVGNTVTEYFNSTVVAEGWAAMSTDSATGDGLTLCSYNSDAIAENGGYGVYADSSCSDYLYATNVTSAEIGVIISNNGLVYAGAGSDADEELLEDNTGATTDAGSVITAGRNDYQLHSPDMMGQGTAGYQAQMTVENSTLITTTDLESTEDYYATYGDAVGAYVDYISGANILVKSTGAVIDLNNVETESYTDTLLLTTINSDSMSRYLKSEGYDVELTITESEISGNIQHDDFQRDLYVTIEDSEYTGAVNYTEYAEWNAAWADYAEDDSCYWILDEDTYITETHDTEITLTGSVWYVDEDSEITALNMDGDSSVVIPEGVTLTVDGVSYTNATLTYDEDTDTIVSEDGEAEGDDAGSSETAVSYGDTLCVRRGNVYCFSYSISSGVADLVFTYGRDADEVLVGDWDGDGVDTLCVRRGNAYYFSNSLTDNDADLVIDYGKSTDEALAGDWDGDGTDTLCVRRGNSYYISNSLESGYADLVIDYGKSTDEVLAGDWDGDGADTLCIRRGSSYYISNSPESGNADQVVDYGKSTDEALAGDWDEDGADTLCVRRGNSYYISNSLTSDAADQVIAYGKSTDEVYAGTWQTAAVLNTYTGVLGSWSGGGEEDYQFTAAIFLYKDDYTTWSNPGLVKSGAYDADSAANVVINDTTSGDNGIILYNVGTYSIANASIVLDTNADGTDTCDFSGRGSAIAVYGDSAVTISDSHIETTGVATMPVFADSGSAVTIEKSTLISNGGTLYGDYMNTPDQALMVAPPWILGIMGTSRCTNLMGSKTTMNVIDSDTQAGAWAVLSTDSGSNMYLNIYGTSLTLNNADESAAALLQETTRSDGSASQLYVTNDNPYTTNYGSGYGTYVIGNAVETFAGATVNVGTYASIFTGGSATYTGIEAGKTYTLSSADGKNDIEYTATETRVTEINSDTFGFMFHQSANYITIEEGTIVNSGYATFLVKSGSANETVNATIDDAEISNGGVLIQMMDNDDATNGGMMSANDEQNFNGSSMNFRTVHTENEGFNTGTASNGGTVQKFTFTNGDYTGNVYNASGSDQSTEGSLKASTLNLTLGTGAVLTGTVASTSAIHVTYAGSQIVRANGGDAYDSAEDAAEVLAEQNTSFDATEYYSIGQVANLVNYNGGNDINVTLTDDAVWNVDGTSVITSLSISDNAIVIVAEGVTLTVDGVVYEAGTYDANIF